MKKIDRLSVFFDDGTEKRLVGTLALYKNRFAAFSYSDEWISTGFSISPFSLPIGEEEREVLAILSLL
ncbi:MAG: HipA N-terminal domain-containing protein [Treponema sp.]|nr:HipA N-terminal domain-containing protein [Treponema sp.]